MKRQAAATVYVAMSGGVDSSVAAYLLVKEGYAVTGVFMKPWQPAGMQCLWERDREDALRVAARLGIPLKSWDFSAEYGRRVAAPMVAEYRHGLTPNPDVECNRHIKFGLFADRAFREGAEYIATGHYARIRSGTLATARDTNKDQTYFLWAVEPDVLKRTLFPVGDLTKPEVRAYAKRAGLAVAQKPDSQGVCFVGDMDVKSFLASRIKSRRGRITHRDGRVLGTHDGAAYYTIGQRHGLDIRDGGGPYFVLERDVRRNIIVVGSERDLYRTRVHVRDVRWTGSPVTSAQVRIRHRGAMVPAKIRRGVVTFATSVRAIAPGQSAVFYRRGRCVGGGIMV